MPRHINAGLNSLSHATMCHRQKERGTLFCVAALVSVAVLSATFEFKDGKLVMYAFNGRKPGGDMHFIDSSCRNYFSKRVASRAMACPRGKSFPIFFGFDTADIEERDGFRLELVQGKKHQKNPLVVPDTAAEGEAVVLGGTVRYDEKSQKFRMWYQGVDKGTYHLLYAESTDGVGWSKPNLNAFQLLPRGKKNNNIFMSRRYYYTKEKDAAPPLRLCRLRTSGEPLYCDSVERALGQTDSAREKCNVQASVSHLESDSEEQCFTNQDHNPCIMHTPHLGPNKEYTMIAYTYARGGVTRYDGYTISYSPDGVTSWTFEDIPNDPLARHEDSLGFSSTSSTPRIVLPGHADVGWFMYDQVDRVYRGIIKSYLNIRNDNTRIGCTVVAGCGFSRRSILYTSSPDLLTWKDSIPAILPTHQDDLWWKETRYKTQKEDMEASVRNGRQNISKNVPSVPRCYEDMEEKKGWHKEFYGMPIARYKSILFGFVQEYRVGCPERNGVGDIALAISRDGESWTRPFKQSPFVENGARQSAFDHGQIYTGNSFVVVPETEEVRLYYNGFRGHHGQSKHTTGIGFIAWKIDRLASATAITSSKSKIRTHIHLAAGPTMVLLLSLPANSVMRLKIRLWNIHDSDGVPQICNHNVQGSNTGEKLRVFVQSVCPAAYKHILAQEGGNRFIVSVEIQFIVGGEGARLFSLYWE